MKPPLNIFFCVCVQSVMNMMHVISVPYSLMKVNPLSWIQKVCQYKGQAHILTHTHTHLSLISVNSLHSPACQID